MNRQTDKHMDTCLYTHSLSVSKISVHSRAQVLPRVEVRVPGDIQGLFMHDHKRQDLPCPPPPGHGNPSHRETCQTLMSLYCVLLLFCFFLYIYICLSVHLLINSKYLYLPLSLSFTLLSCTNLDAGSLFGYMFYFIYYLIFCFIFILFYLFYVFLRYHFGGLHIIFIIIIIVFFYYHYHY